MLRRRGRTPLLMTAAWVVASCSGGNSSPTPDSEPERTTTTIARASDGALRLGLLVPRSGTGASLGEPLVAVAEASIDRINESGGVNGAPVEIVIRDEGADDTTALAAVAAFVEEDRVDAVVGPLSSRVALSILPTLMDAGVGVCSPAATTTSLADLPDNGLFVRTSPTDTLAALAMAQVAARTGETEIAIAYPDDPYGRDFVADVKRSLELEGLSAAVEVAYDPGDDDYGEEVATTISTSPEVVILLSGSDGGSRFLGTLAVEAPGVTVIVNDAFSSVDFSDDPNLESLAEIDIVGVAVDTFVGTARASGGESPNGPTGSTTTTPVGGTGFPTTGSPATGPPLSTATIDCIDLLALAAESAGSDDPGVFMPLVIPASKGGSGCTDFASCRELLESGLNIDYNGPSSVLSLDPNGDPLLAVFVTFGIDAAGSAEYRDTIGVVSAP